ncbi:MAG: sugar ABC transporter permease, partial [Erysipelotrichaceae bacterium]|nr:sugar ABC transporter permease [Erysipelotrichaceae bacterium]
ILWVIGAVPQFLVAMLLALFFTSTRLNIKGQQFFKTVIYMPNLIMASAFSMLFFTMFSQVGPINQLLVSWGVVDKAINFLAIKISVRSLIALMNFLMWFGNTTILLMAGIQGIDEALFESARLDGSSSTQVFFHITMPLLMPIFIYVFITSMIGGIQMFDVPQVLTNGKGTPDNTSTTLIMYLNNFLGLSKNYGMAGALSVLLFIMTAILSTFVFKTIRKK